MPEIGTSGSMSGEGNGVLANRPQATAPVLDSTLKDMNVMREAVEERAGEPLRAEYARPLVERQIARDQRAASLVALAEDLEQQLGPSRRKRHVAEFIDDQQPVASELTLEPQEPFLVTRLEQFVDESRRRDEADRQALLAGRQSEPERDVALARPAVADGDDVLAPLDVVRARQLQHQHLVQRWQS